MEFWHSGPFDPVIKDGKIYARGSADDKGQFYMHVKALETISADKFTYQPILNLLLKVKKKLARPILENL